MLGGVMFLSQFFFLGGYVPFPGFRLGFDVPFPGFL